MKNPFRIGSAIYLRPLEREDAPLFVTWLNDPEVTRTLNVYRPVDLPSEEEFIATIPKSDTDFVFGVALIATDHLIGTTGLHDVDWKNRHASFGINVGAKHEWGKGYGTDATVLTLQYAFETLNLHRVRLLVYEHNARAIRLYENVGFQREGLLREDRYHEGRYWNTITMAMLRDEWDRTQSRRGG
ncbi:MAG TPA: GNAT family protein [Candidatus Binatia bacterium]|nr:GNAT family protein [Candidatus Binatia bacterium]